MATTMAKIAIEMIELYPDDGKPKVHSNDGKPKVHSNVKERHVAP